MADGIVKIDVQLQLNGAQAGAKALAMTLKGVDVPDSAAAHVEKLNDELQKVSRTAKTAEGSQKSLSTSLTSQAHYWDNLSEAQEKVGLKTSATVSHLNSLKAQLAQTNVETEQAKNKLKELIIAEGEDSDATKEAASSYAELLSKQSALGMEVSQLSAKYGGLTPKMAAMADKAEALGNKLQTTGQKISSIGNKMTIGLTAPIAAGLAMAGKAAVTFDSQIQSMGSLLDDGSKSASQLKAELSGLGDASKKWSVQYGVSTSSINDGMSELIKKGYTYNQVLGAMPSILDATRASGDEFNDVMSVSTSVLEQFGLKSNNTATMLKNTQRVTDSLTYVANATSAGFSDMGNAMEYVGPVASGLNISLEQTSAMIGEMSNQGIEGEKAGTALRGALSALLTPSKQNMVGFKNLGVSVSDFKKGTLTVPQMLDNIKESSKGMTKQQLQSNLALAFGTEAQTGMNILVNQGGDALRKLTSETEKSTGYTKKLAETMNNTSQANVEKFKSALNVLAVTAGSQLLPAITDLVKEGTKLVTWFSNLDEGTQKLIIKSALAVAAGGPLISMFGKLTSGVGGLIKNGAGAIKWFGRLASGTKKASSETEILTAILETLKGGSGAATAALGTVTTAAEGTGVGLAGASTGVAGFTAMLGTIGPAIAVAGIAVAAGVAYWKLYGKEAQASAERTSRWGSDIGASADKSATKMRTASGEISGAFTDTNHTVQQNAKTIVTGFNSMTAAAKKAATESDTAAKKMAKSLGGSAGDALLAAAAKEKTANAKRIKQMKDNAKKAEQITKNANKTGQALTADQIQVLENLRQSSAAQAVKTMQLSGKNENNVLKAILGEKVTMSQEAAQKQYSDMQYALQDEYRANTKAQQKIKDNAQLTTAEKNAALEGLEKDHQTKLDSIYQGAIQAASAQGESNHEIQQQLQTDFDLTATEAQNAMDTYTQAMAKGVNSSKQFAASVKDGMSKEVKQAGNDWNSLVLDPKTGKVKTNLADVLKDTASTKKGWNQLMFDLKYAKISSNAKQTIVEAMAASKQWQSMPAWEKTAVIQTQGRTELAQVMTDFQNWDSFSLKEQQAIVKGDYSALVNALVKSGDWNKLSLKQQQAIVADKATVPLVNMLVKSREWNKLSVKEKSAVVNAKGTTQVAELALKYNAFDKLPNATKTAALKDADFRSKLADNAIKYNNFKSLPDATKKALLDDKDIRTKLINAGVLIDKYNLNNPKKKTATADTKNAQNNFGLGKKAVDAYKKADPGKTKVAKGKNDASKPMKDAKKSTDNFRNTSTGPTKIAKGQNAASKLLDHATRSAKSWQGQGMGSTKTAKAKDSASSAAKKATDAVSAFQKKPSLISKTLSVVANIAGKAGKLLGFKNGTSYFGGGLAMVNDQMGPTFREAIVRPNGQVYSFEGRNVVTPIERGSEIIPAAKSRQMNLVPRYASGTGGAVTDAIDRYMSYTPEMASSFQVQPIINVDNSASNKALTAISATLTALNDTLKALADSTATGEIGVVEVHNDMTLPTRVIKDITPAIQVELDRLTQTKNRTKGRLQ